MLQEPHGVAFQKTAFFIVTAVKTSNLTFTQLVNESPAFYRNQFLRETPSEDIILK
jgi:hypothetical protein